MKKLSVDQIVSLHHQLTLATGGLDGIRDIGLIESAVNSAFEVYFGVDQYPRLEEKATRLCFALVKNHGFLDGNKRIGVFAMLVFLDINDCSLNLTDDDIVRLGLGVASSELNYEDILRFIEEHKA